MRDRAQRGRRGHDDDLNRGDYRSDFGPEGRHRFASPARHQRNRGHHEGHDGRRTFGREGWQRGRVSGGYGSQFDAWRAGLGFASAGFRFGPDEHPSRGRLDDQDWQPTRPARGRSAWAGDWSEQDYRGRGPRDYRRADDRVRDEVCERLTDDWGVDATDINVQVQDGEVTLTGTVPTREQKRRAGACVEGVPGVHDVFNQVRVADLKADSRPWRAGDR
jgi:hypothetical protein